VLAGGESHDLARRGRSGPCPHRVLELDGNGDDMADSDGNGMSGWRRGTPPWAILSVLVVVVCLAVGIGLSGTAGSSSGSDRSLQSAIESTMNSKSFVLCGDVTASKTGTCYDYHSPDQLEQTFSPPYSYQRLIFSGNMSYASLGYGQALSGSPSVQAATAAALQKADLYLERSMARQELRLEVHQSVFDVIDGLQSVARSGTTTQSGSVFTVKSESGTVVYVVGVQSNVITSIRMRAELSPGIWTTSLRRLSQFGQAPPILLPRADQIVKRSSGGCADQNVVPQCL